MATVLLARHPLTGPLREGEQRKDEGGENQERESCAELGKGMNVPSETARLVASARNGKNRLSRT